MLTFDVGDAAPNPDTAELFAEARRKIPVDVDWPAQFELRGDKVIIEIASDDLPADPAGAYLFVESRKLVKYGSQTAGFTRAGLSFSMEAARRAADEAATRAVLAYTDASGEQRAVGVAIDKASGPLATGAASVSMAASGGGLGFWEAAFYAFLGGIILNLMPCVFPILSMKALSLMNMAKQDQGAARESGLLYTLGVLVAFAAIGIAILGFRAAGNAVYWGFQFQNGPREHARRDAHGRYRPEPAWGFRNRYANHGRWPGADTGRRAQGGVLHRCPCRRRGDTLWRTVHGDGHRLRVPAVVRDSSPSSWRWALASLSRTCC